MIKNKAKELNRTPTSKEMKHFSIIVKRFGSWNNALEKAELKINRYPYRQDYTKEELINVIKKKVKELGRIPKASEIKEITPILKQFKTWNNALKQAELKVNKRRYTEQDLLKIIKSKANELGRTPKFSEIKEIKPVLKTFGTWNNALKNAELKINRKRSKNK